MIRTTPCVTRYIPQHLFWPVCPSSRRHVRFFQSAVYPFLDHGVAAPGECLRKVATPPVVVPLITGPPGSSSSRHDGGGKSWRGEFLPTMGRFPAGEAGSFRSLPCACVRACVRGCACRSSKGGKAERLCWPGLAWPNQSVE